MKEDSQFIPILSPWNKYKMDRKAKQPLKGAVFLRFFGRAAFLVNMDKKKLFAAAFL